MVSNNDIVSEDVYLNLPLENVEILNQYNIYPGEGSNPFCQKNQVTSKYIDIDIKNTNKLAFVSSSLDLYNEDEGEIRIESKNSKTIKVVQANNDFINVDLINDDKSLVYQVGLNKDLLDKMYNNKFTLKINGDEIKPVNSVFDININDDNLKISASSKALSISKDNTNNSYYIDIKPVRVNNKDLRISLEGNPINFIDSDDIKIVVIDSLTNQVKLMIKDRIKKIIFDGKTQENIDGVVNIKSDSLKKTFYGEYTIDNSEKLTSIKDFGFAILNENVIGEKPIALNNEDSILIYIDGILISKNQYTINTTNNLFLFSNQNLSINSRISWLIIKN